jgi:uncharacterized membrane protein
MRILLAALFVTMAAGCTGSQDVSIEDAENATYRGILDDEMQLAGGVFESPPFVEGANSRSVVRLVPGVGIVGDIDTDGDDEAIVALVSTFGGSGTFTHLAIVDSAGGSTMAIATIALGDRVRIESLLLDGGTVIANTMEHAVNDAMCCPSLERQRRWQFANGVLVEIPGAATRLRGHIVIGHEVRSFTECNSGTQTWLIDRTNGDLRDVYDGLSGNSYQPLFFEVSGSWGDPPDTGFGTDYAASITVDSVLRAEREGKGCGEDLTTSLYRASGNEPSWQLVVSENELHFIGMDRQPLTIPDPTLTSGGDAVRIDGGEISAVIDSGRCTDPMSGSVFAFTASVTAGDSTFAGCAVQGLLHAN